MKVDFNKFTEDYVEDGRHCAQDVIDLANYCRELKADLKEYSDWKTEEADGMPEDGDDIYILKIDTGPLWIHMAAFVKDQIWFCCHDNNPLYRTPNYYKLLTRVKK